MAHGQATSFTRSYLNQDYWLVQLILFSSSFSVRTKTLPHVEWVSGHATINGIYCPPWWPWTEITCDPSKILVLLLCPNLYCLLHDRPVSRETVCWGQGIVNVFGKPAYGEGGVPKNHLPWDSIHASLILKEVSVYLVSANFLVLESFVLAAVHSGSGHSALAKLQLDIFIFSSATF